MTATPLRSWFAYATPALMAGVIMLFAFVFVGHTPLIRGMGAAMAVVGLAMALRRFGTVYALLGGLILGLSPAFWSQAGGLDNSNSLILGIVAIAGLAAVLLLVRGYMPNTSVLIGIALFSLLFQVFVGTPRSQRLTTILSAWLIYLLVDALLTAHPRPNEAQPTPLNPYYLYGMLGLLTIGILNDPLFSLFTLPVVICLYVSKTSIPPVYWLVVAIISIIGFGNLAQTYLFTDWWHFSAETAMRLNLHIPFLLKSAWQEPLRWVNLGQLIVSQFTLPGLLFALIGLARLSRWYPPLGTLTLLTFCLYFVFGLMYFGRDGRILLLPMFMLITIWLVYALYSAVDWTKKFL